MKRIKYLLILPALITLSFLSILVTARAESGQCGDNIDYNIENGVLTFAGSGILDTANNDVIRQKKENINAVVVNEGITEIATSAFDEFTNLSVVSLPSTLVKIGDNAFRYTSITDLVLPEGCKEIGNYAFAFTKKLEIADVRSAETMGIGAFMYSNVSSVMLSDKIGVLRGQVFEWCQKLTQITLPEGLLKINGSAFHYCSNLTKINYPSTLTYIGTYAFAFTKISTFDFPTTTKIGSHAFVGVSTPKPVIVKDLPDLTKINSIGEMVNLQIEAEGYRLKYNWYYKNVSSKAYTLSAQHSPTYQLAFKESNTNRKMYCVITDVFGNKVQTNTTTFSYKLPEIEIISQPKSVFVANEGDKATVSIEATGSNLTYTWYYKNTNMTKFVKSACTKNIYTIPVTKERDCRQMYCVITDSAGKKEYSRRITFAINDETSQPKSVMVANEGDKATVRVEPTDDDMTYAWYYKNAYMTKFAKSSITKSTYTIAVTKLQDCRQMYCVVTDKTGKKYKTKIVTLAIDWNE